MAAVGGERLDRFLTRQLPDASRVQIQYWIRQGEVQVAGVVCRRPAARLRGGEAVALAAAPAPAAASLLTPTPLPLEIVFEDEDLAVVHKPAGLVVHPAAGARGPTLVHALLHHFGAAALSAGSAPDRPGIVHRLDRDTSGLMVIAKNDWAHRRLAQQFQERQVRKRYLALAHGWTAASGRVDAPIARDLRRRQRMTTRRAAGRDAHTLYRRLERLPHAAPADGSRPPRYSYLELEILTGRTHQIRVHMASMGHPVVGDRLYGAPARWADPSPMAGEALGRLFLHAAELALAHPRTAEPLQFQAPLPAELAAWLERLRGPGVPAAPAEPVVER
ncbi:MAG: RluA family pseudouridine synthase [Terriglobales bacterium]